MKHIDDEYEGRCHRCGSDRWGSVSLDGAWTRIPQCVPCGAYHRGVKLGHGSEHPHFYGEPSEQDPPAPASPEPKDGAQAPELISAADAIKDMIRERQTMEGPAGRDDAAHGALGRVESVQHLLKVHPATRVKNEAVESLVDMLRWRMRDVAALLKDGRVR